MGMRGLDKGGVSRPPVIHQAIIGTGDDSLNSGARSAEYHRDQMICSRVK
jgi:hypothetical protein